ncbi:uncharacterized protein LOC127535506 [Acanthochromis polyacanthus]|uniref:uncharacterized protein LOC127535506 n=1 Tax=Acanthochromis polyacanthus TaxID=80966 RepID=UPI002234C969|nr:uncharacterized protein LOC127535506 [Acanthochromis polyacanthus]
MVLLDNCGFCVLLLSISTGFSCQQLTVEKNEESSLEGSTVTLTYKYSQTATYSDYFFWYQQHPGKPPEFLIFHTVAQNETKAGLSVIVSGDKKEISMKISSAAVTDSAVYYCALQLQSPGTSSVSSEELTPVNNEEYSLVENTVSLSYKASKVSTGDYFFWYRQHPGKPPQLLISHSNSGTIGSKEDDRLKIQVEGNQMTTEISSAAVTDSAVYYCAVKPTVTGNSKTLYKNLWSKDNRKLHNIH